MNYIRRCTNCKHYMKITDTTRVTVDSLHGKPCPEPECTGTLYLDPGPTTTPSVPKIISIQVSYSGNIYALDEVGDVWSYGFESACWRKLGMDRKIT